jgi:hypothetical protein
MGVSDHFLNVSIQRLLFFILKKLLIVEIKHPRIFFFGYVVVVDDPTIVQVLFSLSSLSAHMD